MASRSLYDLDPELRQIAHRWLAALTVAGIDVLIYCTYRSNEEQAELYAQGRTKPGRIVTWAPPGKSKHNVTLPDGRTPAARAFDFVPMRSGKAVWGLKTQEDRDLWERCVEEAEKLGLASASRWPKQKSEWPHLELPT